MSSRDDSISDEGTTVSIPAYFPKELRERLQGLDRKIEKHQKELKTEFKPFAWCNLEPFEFYFLFNEVRKDVKEGKRYLHGFARGIEDDSEPFNNKDWEETLLPLASELENWLHDFGNYFDEVKEIEDLKNQMFYVKYLGIDTFDDPNLGAVRLYDFYVEIIDENAKRITLEQLEALDETDADKRFSKLLQRIREMPYDKQYPQ